MFMITVARYKSTYVCRWDTQGVAKVTIFGYVLSSGRVQFDRIITMPAPTSSQDNNTHVTTNNDGIPVNARRISPRIFLSIIPHFLKEMNYPGCGPAGCSGSFSFINRFNFNRPFLGLFYFLL